MSNSSSGEAMAAMAASQTSGFCGASLRALPVSLVQDPRKIRLIHISQLPASAIGTPIILWAAQNIGFLCKSGNAMGCPKAKFQKRQS
jgi:hypothetical protein